MSEQAQESPETGVGAAPAADLTPDAAQAELQRLGGDKAFQADLMRGWGPSHVAAHETWQGLLKTAYSGSESGTASPAERAMADALQPPASPDEYKVVRDLAVAGWDDSLEGEARSLAHAVGLNNGQLDGVVMIWNQAADRYRKEGPPSPEAEAAAHDQAMSALRAKHGDRTDAVLQRANLVLKSLPEQQRKRVNELINNYGLSNSAWLTEQLAMVADRRGLK